MNNLLKIILAILGGIDVIITIATPIILVILWINIASIKDWTTFMFYGFALLATLFRAIKIGVKGDLKLYSDLVKAGFKK